MSELSIKQIEKIIYIIRGQKVMLDSDLAELYGVETKQLNRQVRRNIQRFPNDFLFHLTPEEYETLKCQIGTSNMGRGGKQKMPLVFTENGVAMLSGVLNSNKAISVNISIMRTFTKLRQILLSDESISEKIKSLENDSREMEKIFRIVFDKINQLECKIPILPDDRKKIGLK